MMPDSDGYPTEIELDTIKIWDTLIPGGVYHLLIYIEKLWHWADWGFCHETTERDHTLELHTGGWSGNEDIVAALKANVVFWASSWKASLAGGHYYFIFQQ